MHEGNPSRVVPRVYRLVPDEGAGRFFYAKKGVGSPTKEECFMANGVCDICDGVVALPEGAVAGEILRCPDCGTELEVVSLDPLRLEEAPQVQEDWGE